MKNELFKELAFEGAKAEIQRIQDRLTSIYNEFPALFPQGAPSIGPVKRTAKALRSKDVQGLIDGAEKLHKAHTTKRKAKKNYVTKRQPENIPIAQLSDPTGKTVTLKEAARIVGLTESAVRLRLHIGKLRPVAESDAPGDGLKRVYREDLITPSPEAVSA